MKPNKNSSMKINALENYRRTTIFKASNCKNLAHLIAGSISEGITKDNKILSIKISQELTHSLKNLDSSQQDFSLMKWLLPAFSIALSRYTRQNSITVNFENRAYKFAINENLQLPEFVKQINNAKKEQQTAGKPSVEFAEKGEKATASSSHFSFLYTEQEDSLSFDIKYNLELFEELFIRQFYNSFETLLANIANNPHQKISQLSITSEEERHRELFEWNNTKKEYPKDLIHKLFEKRCLNNPDEVMIVYEGELSADGKHQELSKTTTQIYNAAKKIATEIRKQYPLTTGRKLEEDLFNKHELTWSFSQNETEITQIIADWNGACRDPSKNRYLLVDIAGTREWHFCCNKSKIGVLSDKVSNIESLAILLGQRLKEIDGKISNDKIHRNILKDIITCIAHLPTIAHCVSREKTEEVQFGIWMAGAAVVALDPMNDSEELLLSILNDSEAKLLIIEKEFAHRMIGLTKTSVQLIYCDDDNQSLEKIVPDTLQNIATEDDLAWVQYSSGTTGLPKGVLVEHASARNLSHAYKDAMELQPGDKTLLHPPVTFDGYWATMLPASLSESVTLFVPSQITKETPRDYVTFMQEHEITVHPFIPPGFLAQLPADVKLPKLRLLIVAAEKPNQNVLDRWAEKKERGEAPVKILQAFGPSEHTVCSTIKIPYTNGTSVNNVGLPIANQTVSITYHGEPLPPTVPGEFLCGGIGVARGYLNQPQKTATQFILKDNNKFYRSGDYGQRLPNGELALFGRQDRRYKLRGQLIDLNELESLLNTHEEIKQSAAVIRETANGKQRLIAFVVVRDKKRLSLKALETYILSHLKSHYHPHRLEQIVKMPITKNGKIAYQQLPEVDLLMRKTDIPYVTLKTETERKVAIVWAKALGLRVKSDNTVEDIQLGRDDDFFDLNGDSQAAIEATALIDELYPASKINATHLYKLPQLHQYAAFLENPQNFHDFLHQEINFRKEAELNPELIKTFERDEAWQWDCSYSDPNQVFLTGTTGFIGAHLLCEILKRTNADLFCLVRATDAHQGKARIISILKQYQLWDETFDHRINAVPGDLGKQKFGLSEDEFLKLTDVDLIFHCGAKVNFSAGYQQLKKANVGGTDTILQLASANKRKQLIPVHHVSTIGIFGMASILSKKEKLIEETRTGWVADYLNIDIGYDQSKWVAEQHIWDAYDQGMPVTVFRPGFVFCNGKSGLANTADFWARMIKGCIAMGCYPDLAEEPFEFITADELCRNLVALALKKESIGNAFHLTPYSRADDLSFGEFFELITSTCKIQLECILYQAWTEKLRTYIHSDEEDNPLKTLYSFLTDKRYDGRAIPDLYRDYPSADAANVRNNLPKDMKPTKINRKIVSRYLNYLISSGFIEGEIYGIDVAK